MVSDLTRDYVFYLQLVTETAAALVPAHYKMVLVENCLKGGEGGGRCTVL